MRYSFLIFSNFYVEFGNELDFGVYRGNNAKGGMRYAFPPYGLQCEA